MKKLIIGLMFAIFAFSANAAMYNVYDINLKYNKEKTLVESVKVELNSYTTTKDIQQIIAPTICRDIINKAPQITNRYDVKMEFVYYGENIPFYLGGKIQCKGERRWLD